MPITGAQAIIKALELEGVETIFGYPGAAICPFYDALYDSGIRHILSRNEQGAAHAASGYARATGRTGVCAVTSGPGSTNLITGIATAYMDSIPLVAITGQVTSDLIGHDSFQEADTTGATSPFTKHNYLVKSAAELPRILREAFYIASTGRPGPVVIDIPQDVQASRIDFAYPESVDLPGYHPDACLSREDLAACADLLRQSRAPIICAGGGIISGNASGELIHLAEKFQIPVVTTLMGIGALPARHPLNLGILGSHGVYAANFALLHADLILIVGARIGNRAMGAASEIARRARVIHIDIDPAELGKNIRPQLPIVANARQALALLSELDLSVRFDEWATKTGQIRQSHKLSGLPPHLPPRRDSSVFPPYILETLAGICGEQAIITTEVGQNQIWAANHYPIQLPRTFLSSGGMGTMGYGLPAAIGAKIGCPDKPVIAVSGDGSLQMSLQELGTIRHYNLDVKILLFNNQRLGMVHEMQKQKFCGRCCQVFLDHNPDFSLLAAAFGMGYGKLEDNQAAEAGLRQMMAAAGPFLLECTVDPDEPTLYSGKNEKDGSP
ncbi:MAG TPA: biosynthetic-type acetolactate synthase large subunit [Clostridiales bacterium]|nr:biosynthetic-type acetolactate synthase large subunit [Clostridiales bacterium]